MTWSLCPEYWDDLWDKQPAVLLVGENPDLTTAITRVVVGTYYRDTPNRTTLLTATERRILRFLAYGLSNQEIADKLSVQCQSVRNSLATIYEKLNLTSRSEALLYYWGIYSDPT